MPQGMKAAITLVANEAEELTKKEEDQDTHQLDDTHS